jgi:hypothetical protein
VSVYVWNTLVNDETESVLVKLTRMEGKLDLSNLRHEQHDQRFSAIDGRLNSHGERLSGIERREAERGGERRGLATGGRIMWAALGFAPGATLAFLALLKVFQ